MWVAEVNWYQKLVRQEDNGATASNITSFMCVCPRGISACKCQPCLRRVMVDFGFFRNPAILFLSVESRHSLQETAFGSRLCATDNNASKVGTSEANAYLDVPGS